MNGKKRCCACCDWKDFSEFYKDKRTLDGYKARCIPCWKKNLRRHRRADDADHCRRCGADIDADGKTGLCGTCWNRQRRDDKLANAQALIEAQRVAREAAAIAGCACQPGGYAISQPGQAWGWNGWDEGPELGMMEERSKG